MFKHFQAAYSVAILLGGFGFFVFVVATFFVVNLFWSTAAAILGSALLIASGILLSVKTSKMLFAKTIEYFEQKDKELSRGADEMVVDIGSIHSKKM